MNDLDELYRELILDHNRSPRNRGPLESADQHANGHNPLCGDHITVAVKLENNVVTDVKFEGSGCAISTASASLMTESVKGKTLDQVKALFRRFHGMVTGRPEEPDGPELGKLAVFSGVGKYPARVKCATLAWHTVAAALSKEEDRVVTTE